MTTLKTGDPCPCCGKPIKWKNPQILDLIGHAFEGELTQKGLDRMLELMEQERKEAADG